jgi:hypothetical protein
MTIEEIRTTQRFSVAEIVTTRYNDFCFIGVALISNPLDSQYLFASPSIKVAQIILDHKNNDSGIRKRFHLGEPFFLNCWVRFFPRPTIEEAEALKEQILRIISTRYNF